MVLVAIIRNAGGERVAAGFSRAQSGQEQTRARRRSIKAAAAALGRRGGGRGGPAARAAVRHLFLFQKCVFFDACSCFSLFDSIDFFCVGFHFEEQETVHLMLKTLLQF